MIRALKKKLFPVCEEVSAEIYNIVLNALPQVRELDFRGNDYDDNRLMFALLNIALVNGVFRANYLSPSYDEEPAPSAWMSWLDMGT